MLFLTITFLKNEDKGEVGESFWKFKQKFRREYGQDQNF